MEDYKVRSPRQAALDLTRYVADKNADLGSRKSPSEFVRAAQRDMGSLVNDGIFGPKTKARAASLLTGQTDPSDAPTPVTSAALMALPEPAVPSLVANTQPQQSFSSISLPIPSEYQQPEIEPAPEYGPAVGPIVAAPASLPVLSPAAAQAAADIPATTRLDIIAALRDFSAQQQATKADYDALIQKLSDNFTTKIKAISSEVETAALQRQATSEHNALVRDSERWNKNTENQQAILNKLVELMKATLANNSVTQRVYQAYGVRL